MATIGLEQVTKVYPNGFKAVKEIDLEVAQGEFMVLVGPSGCGKTTLLRKRGGARGDHRRPRNPPSAVASSPMLDPRRERDVAMVFQNDALYPHMTVRREPCLRPRFATPCRPRRDR